MTGGRRGMLIGLALPVLLVLAVSTCAIAEERFPPPDFSVPHPLPITTTPPVRAIVWEYIDLAVLAGGLVLATLLALKWRNRRGIAWLGLIMMGYLGFFRHGCVCPIGAIQNLTAGLADPTYIVPLAALGFFLLPVILTMLVGRTFCGSVCPLGAVQDLVVLRPLKVPAALEHALGLLAWAYLGLGVLFAALGSAFVICQYDPFVPIFRRSGSVEMLVVGACMLLIGVFVARPYCRYICPLGALFRPLSAVSKWHCKITPTDCTSCRLCEDSCPFGAIDKPTASVPDRKAGKTALAVAMALLPVLIAAGAGLTYLAWPAIARSHPTIRLAERISLEESGNVKGTINISDAFRQSQGNIQALYAEAGQIRRGFQAGSAILGGFLGLVVGLKLVSVSTRRRRTTYSPNRARCLSCGRCFAFCPEHKTTEPT